MTFVPKQARQVASGYLPTLDGWRTIAVLSVIAYHDRLHSFGGLSDSWLHAQGFLGVDLFFAISGLLICSRLMEEEAKTGRISLRNFYVRRSLRILPAMLVYLIVVAVLGLLRIVHVGWRAWLASLLFFNNYYSAIRRDADWSLYTNHFWSLSVEEHFYLFFPAILLFFPRIRLRLLAFLTTLSFAWNLLHAMLVRHDAMRAYDDGRTDLRIYSLLFPAALAILLREPILRQRIVRYCKPSIVFPVVALGSLLGALLWIPFAYRFVVPFGFPFLIMSTMLHPRNMMSRLLEWAPLKFMGRISYSTYLWQQLFFNGDHPAAKGLVGLLQKGPWNIVATLSIATASYFLVERPLVRIGHSLAAPATPGYRDLATPAHSL